MVDEKDRLIDIRRIKIKRYPKLKLGKNPYIDKEYFEQRKKYRHQLLLLEIVKKCLSRMSGKLSCTVLRRGNGSNSIPLFAYTSKVYQGKLKGNGNDTEYVQSRTLHR